ncbi:hypothetical protein EII17_06040 [Clostridiales bacterium COT073_COT-073]|nr:hypothetical protein EII17_06040 [Clostridiales bacterium COT073_COT-073]
MLFLHTATDLTVPPENSLLMAEACKKGGVCYALHIFSRGSHGLSLANHKWAAFEDRNKWFMLLAKIKALI